MSDILNTILDDGFDPRYVAAGDVLVKIAEDEGIDLDSISDEEISTMLTDIVSQEATGEGGEGGGEGGGEPGTETGGETGEGADMGKESSITHGSVSRELVKIASSEGVDLSSLSQGEYDEVYNDLANAMATPGYFQKQAAAVEKLAEADAIGRAMAHSFDDELRKLADNGDGTTKEAMGGRAGHYAREAFRKATGKAGRAASQAAGAVRGAAGKARAAESAAAGGIGKGVGKTETGKKMTMAIAKRLKGTPAERLAKARRIVGRGAAGAAAAGAAGAGAGAYGAGKMSFDEDVMSTARQMLANAGINPDSGEKVAEDYEGNVAASAIALLEENGYTFG